MKRIFGTFKIKKIPKKLLPFDQIVDNYPRSKFLIFLCLSLKTPHLLL